MIQDHEVLKWIALAVFVGAYAAFMRFQDHRSLASAIAALVCIASGVIPFMSAFFRADTSLPPGAPETGEGGPYLNWNVMGVFLGTLVVAELFTFSRAPEVIAEKLLALFRSPRWALVALCLFGGFTSFFLENVAAVLLLAPIAISVAKKLKQPLTPVLIGLVLQSNLHGCGTMIGDPPDMLLAGYTKMNFTDFFWFHGRPSLFFAVVVGSLTGSAYLAFNYRTYTGSLDLGQHTRVRSWFPLALLAILIGALAGSSFIDPAFSWAAGTATLVAAAIGIGWYVFVAEGAIHSMEAEEWDLEFELTKGGEPQDVSKEPKLPRLEKLKLLVKNLDWDSAVFLVGIFIFVGGFTKYWVGDVASGLSKITGGTLPGAFAVLVSVSMAASAFIDNVPYVMAMLPVTDVLGGKLGLAEGDAQKFFLYFGLLIGGSVGGNITPIGATANVVAMGILKRQGEPVRFGRYVQMGLPFSVFATAASCAFLSLFWLSR